MNTKQEIEEEFDEKVHEVMFESEDQALDYDPDLVKSYIHSIRVRDLEHLIEMVYNAPIDMTYPPEYILGYSTALNNLSHLLKKELEKIK